MPETNTLPPVTDVRSAAAHIEGLLDLGNETVRDDAAQDDGYNESAEADAPEDMAPDEMPASHEDEGSDEPAIAPAIEAPKSWSAEDQAKFNELPPDTQKIIARRESERDKAVNQRMQQIAEERKSIEAEVSKANQVQAQYAQTLQQVLNLTYPELQEIEQTDFVKLAQENPAEYVRLSAVRDGLRQRVVMAQQSFEHAQQAQLIQAQRAYQARYQEQHAALVSQIPEFGDPDKAKTIAHDITSTMENFGFSSDEIGGVTDARIVRALHRLTQLEKQEAARKSALGKKGAAPAQRLMPATATPIREDNRSKRVAEQFSALKKSGSARDAARLLENIL